MVSKIPGIARVELARRPNFVAVAALAVNVVIVIYLLRRPRTDLAGQPMA